MKDLGNWNFWGPVAFIFYQMIRIIFQVRHVHSRADLHIIKLPVFMKKKIHSLMQQFSQFRSWKYCFQAWINEREIVKFSWGCTASPRPPQTQKLLTVCNEPQHLTSLGFFLICNNTFLNIYQWRFFFYFRDRLRFSHISLIQ